MNDKETIINLFEGKTEEDITIIQEFEEFYTVIVHFESELDVNHTFSSADGLKLAQIHNKTDGCLTAVFTVNKEYL